MPRGGVKMAVQASEQYGFKTDPQAVEAYTKHAVTHNQAVFDCYTKEIMDARHTHIMTGLPDTYARGRVIGDYRRIALYGVDYLIKDRLAQQAKLVGEMDDEKIRTRYEITQQVKALKQLVEMAQAYGFDITKPAANAKEAIQ